jgi:hypothetical protein
MGVFASLAREHRIFSRAARRCEKSLSHAEADARRELEEALRVLLPALERHEEVEDLLFDDPAYAAQKDAKRILAMLGAQHDEIAALRAPQDERRAFRAKARVSFRNGRKSPMAVLQQPRQPLHSALLVS